MSLGKPKKASRVQSPPTILNVSSRKILVVFIPDEEAKNSFQSSFQCFSGAIKAKVEAAGRSQLCGLDWYEI